MILEDSPIVAGRHWKGFAFSSPLTEQQQKGAVRGSVSSCLKLAFAKLKNRGREKILLFSIKTSGINTVAVEEIFTMMNDAGVTINEYTVPVNKFMVEMKKNYEWN